MNIRLPRIVAGLLGAFWALSPASCSGPPESASDWVDLGVESGDAPLMQITGTVAYVEVEGGFYVIRSDDGVQYDPINLPAEFRQDGMSVEAEAIRRDDMASYHMAGPLVELLRIRERKAEEPASPAEPGLIGTSWRLEDLAGLGVIDRAQATLAFPEEGRVEGSGSCNRFSGSVDVRGDEISFGPLATTRKACVEAVMTQESRYLDALSRATGFTIEEPFLYVRVSDAEAPLRFVRAG